MDDAPWTSVSKRTSKPGRKFGLSSRQATVSEGREPPPPPPQPSAMFDSYRSTAKTSVSQEQFDLSSSFDCGLSEREIEDKFNVISLSIRTEAFTLKNRLEHQHRQRDLAENNLSKEINQLESILLEMRQEVARGVSSNYAKYCEGSQFHELFTRVEHQISAVRNSALFISSVAETLGAVEYESRLSSGVQLVIAYVDTVQRKWEREHRELEETKRILNESGVNVAQCLEAFRERNKPKLATPVPQTTKRRASFPAAPLRRVSMDNSLPTSTAPLKAGQASLAMSKIAEERDTDDDQLKGRAAAAVAAFTSSAASTSLFQYSTGVSATSSSGNQVTSLHGCQSPAASSGGTVASQVTIDTQVVSRPVDKLNPVPPRKERRGAGKSKSWTSPGGGQSLLTGDQKRHGGRSIVVVYFLLWLKTLKSAGHWCQLQSSKCQRKMHQWRHYGQLVWQRKWEASQLLLLARYTAAACCLLAAFISLLVTFVPSMASSVSSIGFRPVTSQRILANNHGGVTAVD